MNSQLRYYYKNREQCIQKRIKYRKEHLDKEKEIRHKRDLKNRECLNQYQKQYKEIYPEWKQYNKDYQKQYRQTEHGKIVHLFNNNKRYRSLGYIPLNSYKSYEEGYIFHHFDETGYGVYMLEEDHTSIPHSVLQNRNMDEINALAFNSIGE